MGRGGEERRREERRGEERRGEERRGEERRGEEKKKKKKSRKEEYVEGALWPSRGRRGHIFVNYELGRIFFDFVMQKIIHICVYRVDSNVQLFRRCEGVVFDDLPVRSTSSALRSLVSTNDISSSPFICFVPVFVPMKLASYRCQSSVCVTTMRLPFERVTSINMHAFAYL